MQVNKTPLRVAVVGHTNTGKTSLLRTLTRDRSFGEVDDAPGTTRQVRSAPVTLNQTVVLVWYDTPGLEDSVALRDRIDGLSVLGKRLDGPDRINAFLADVSAETEFEQEHRVLAQVMRSDAMLYVVDVRDPVLAKHRDEIYLLQSCARPVLPVLNFVASPDANPQPWVAAFARYGMHIHVSFDSISPPIHGLQRLYETLGQLLGQYRPLMESLATQSGLDRRARVIAAADLLADLCLAVANEHVLVKNDPVLIEQAIAEQQQQVRQLEKSFVVNLLRLYQFDDEDYLPPTQGWAFGQWQADLFSRATWSELGVDIGKGAAVGAMAGAAVDVLSAGLSLGTGTLIGAAAGTAWQGIDRWGKGIKATVLGERDIAVSDAVLLALATRNVRLVAALEQRGHASQVPVMLHEAERVTPEFDHGALLAALSDTRQYGFKQQIRQAFGAGPIAQSCKEEVKHLLLDAQALKPLSVDGLH
jgi:hypothetical protein